MGVGISYTSMQAVGPDTRAQLLADATEAANAWDCWSEPLWLEDEIEEPGRLFRLSGFTKLYLPGYSMDGGYQEVDWEEDLLLAWSDANFIVTSLCHWSQRYGVDWSIDVEGPAGSIVNGRPDQKLVAMLQSMRAESPLPESECLRIRQKYSTRNESDYVAWENEEPPPVHEVYPVETLEDREPPPGHAFSPAETTKPWWRFW